jgi:hypothetical protein
MRFWHFKCEIRPLSEALQEASYSPEFLCFQDVISADFDILMAD